MEEIKEGLEVQDIPAPKKKREYKYRLWLVILLSVLSVLAFIVGATFIILSIWYVNTFNLEFKALLYAITAPIEGTGEGTVDQILSACLPWAIAAAALAIVAAIAIAGRRRWQKITRRVAAGICALTLVSSVFTTLYCFGIPEYLATYGQTTNIYEEYYVDPSTAVIKADGTPKNLIYIYLESMETTFMSSDVGGEQEGVNYIPKLTELAQNEISFSNKSDGALGGFYTIQGANSWTMGALFSLTSGLPFSFPVASNDMSKYETFAPGIMNLGDVLEEKGYNQLFICGSDAEFGGRKNYFTQHGNYEIYDLYTARANKDLPSDSYTNGFWGFEDKYLYEIAKEEITRLASEDAPFNVSMLTVDTHFPKGYVCSECESLYDKAASYDGQLKNVLNCADRMISEFIEWCKTQDFYEDTVIIITGDHPVMGTKLELTNGAHGNDRTVYNCIINSAVQPDEKVTENRLFTSMDMFPTTLAAMGFDIVGDRLGLGVNLFSGQKTVIEYMGYDDFKEEILKKSDYYNEFTGFTQKED